MQPKSIKVGRVYAYHPNGTTKEREIVRVIGLCMYARVKGPHRTDVPYNFAPPEHLHRATRNEMQGFVQQMPL